MITLNELNGSGQTKPVRTRQTYDRSTVADRVRLLVEIMSHQGSWSKAEFARRCQLSASQLSHYLAGTHDPDINSLAKIAGGLGVSMEWLVFGAGPMWAQDLPQEGYGASEATLALSALLEDLAMELRRTVARKLPSDEEKTTLDEEEGLGQVVRGHLRRLVQTA